MAIDSRYKAKFGKEVEALPMESEIPFISKWNVAANETITLPVGTEGVNKIEVDWGDGTLNGEHSHTYTTAGDKLISIKGRLEDFRFYTEENQTKLSKENLVEIVEWGDIKFVNLNFRGCTNLALIPDGTKKPPNLINSSSVAYFFFACPITSFPKNLFDSGQNILNIESAFRGTQITAVEEGSFDQLVNIIDGANLFYTSQIVTLPPKLFANSIKLINLRGFCLQVPLTEVPEDLLLGLVSLRSLSRAFRNTLIGEIPRKFLWSCIELRDVEQMCYNSGLTSLHPETFKYSKKVEDFEKFVRNNPSFISDVPPIWMDFPEANAFEAFSVGTFPNVDEIPVEWGGNNTEWATEKGNVTHIWKGTQAGYDNVLPEAWKTNEKVLKIIGNGEVYTGEHGGSGTSSINNITEIANRSYNDLQDLPGGSKILFDSDLENGNYVVKNSDNGKIISFSNVSNASPNVQLDPAILDTGFNLNVKAGYSGKIVTFEATGNTSNNFTVEAGLTGKLRPNGIALLRKSGANVIIGTGEFIKNYELFESPDGTLHKIGVANDGTRTSTPL